MPERNKRKNGVADHIALIAQNLGIMQAKFKAVAIPREAGNYLDSAMMLFDEESTRKLLPATCLNTLAEVRLLSNLAERVDDHIYQGSAFDLERTKWIDKCDDLMGQLRGEADKLRARR